jgi:hypothetical protein
MEKQLIEPAVQLRRQPPQHVAQVGPPGAGRRPKHSSSQRQYRPQMEGRVFGQSDIDPPSSSPAANRKDSLPAY